MKNKNIGGNYFDKYNSNNILIKYAVDRYLARLKFFIHQIGKLEKILDLGCGEGEIVKFLDSYYHNLYIRGYDIDGEIIKELERKYPKYDFLKLDLSKFFNDSNKYDLILCLEVLEHIKNYKQVLKNIKQLNSSYIIISVPNEPWFRIANMLRLKYLKRCGSTPGHVNNFTLGQFKNIIKKYFPGNKIIFKTTLIWNFAFLKPNTSNIS